MWCQECILKNRHINTDKSFLLVALFNHLWLRIQRALVIHIEQKILAGQQLVVCVSFSCLHVFSKVDRVALLACHTTSMKPCCCSHAAWGLLLSCCMRLYIIPVWASASVAPSQLHHLLRQRWCVSTISSPPQVLAFAPFTNSRVAVMSVAWWFCPTAQRSCTCSGIPHVGLYKGRFTQTYSL